MHKQLVKQDRNSEQSVAIGVRLRSLRRRWKFTQAGLAHAVGVTQQSIAYYESGVLPSPQTVYLLANVLGVTPYDLVQDLDSIDPEWRQRLDGVVLAQFTRSTGAGEEGLACCKDRVAAGRALRRAGQLQAGEALARETWKTLSGVVERQPHDLGASLVLLQAAVLLIEVTTEIYRPSVFVEVEAQCQRLLTLARGPLAGYPEAEAHALVHLADIRMLQGKPEQLERAWQTVEIALQQTHDPGLRLRALCIKAAIARRRGGAFVTQVKGIARQIEKGADYCGPVRYAFAQQVIALNLAAAAPTYRRESLYLLDQADQAYRTAQYEDTHVAGLLDRTRSVIAATSGYGSDLDVAQVHAQRGLERAAANGRGRTFKHCSLVVDAANNRQLLHAFPC